MHEKFLKTRNQKMELEYKNYKNLFETIKKRSKKPHYSAALSAALTLFFKKRKSHIKSTAKNFNKYLTEIGWTLGSSSVKYLEEYNVTQPEIN